jgi:class 3 adenylate cyclase/tetratricopeptide (TPR) repeat protein
MICPRCQADNPPNAAFCDECGARLEAACPNCGESNRRSAKFCRNCGQLINQAATTAPAPIPGIPAPETYVPKHLAERILATRHTLEGERKQVTVLFADIRGSTSLLEGIDPEEAQKIIDPVLQVMMDAVHRYEGTVNQVLGDGIMALFGAPLAHEDHALRACYSALAMQEEMRRHRRKLGQSEESGLHIGIGMNTGEVVVRSIGNDLNIEYSALGHTTHLAARMEELAGPGAALLPASTLRQVEGFVQVKSHGTAQVKGVSQPVETYELVGATTARTRVQAAAARGLTPLVGRRAEIEAFNKLVEQVAGGKGQILAMVGEPGMGKSRLVHEFTRHQLRPGWCVLEATSVSYGKATPYYPLIELLRRYFAIEEGDGPENIQDKIAIKVVELDPSLKDAIPPILSVLGALPEANAPASEGQQHWFAQFPEIREAVKRLTNMELRQRPRYTLDALKRVFIRESQKQSLLLVFEDLHWIDNETQDFLDSFVDSIPMARILLVVNYRPGYSHSWGDRSYYTQLRVDPLQSASAEELLQNLLGTNKDLVPLRDLLIKRTEGNPFFAEESVRSLVEIGVLVGEKGAYRPGLKIDGIMIPSTVQNVVAGRIDRLALEEKHVLQIAAVIGITVPFGLLRTVTETEIPEAALLQDLSVLRASEFLYESSLFPELEYTFRHALINEVAYGELLHDRRVGLHTRIFAVMEAMATDGVYDHVEKVAHHAFRGELWEKSVVYLRQAGAKAISHSGFAAALSSYDQAFQALKRLPQSRDTLALEVDLHLDLRNVYFLLGDSLKVAEHLHAAESLVQALGDRQRTVRVLNFLNSYYGLSGDPEIAIGFGQRALALISESDGPQLSVMTDYYLGAAYNKLGQYNQAITVLKRAIRRLVDDLRRERFGTAGYPAVTCRGHLIQCLAATGEFGEGISYAEEGIQIAEEVDDLSVLVYVNCSLAVLFLFRGEFVKSVEILERSLRICHSANVPVYVPYVASRLGAAYSSSGRISEAIPLLEQGVENSTAAGRLAFLSLSSAWLSEGYLRCGRLAEASSVADRALGLSKQHKERGHEAWVLKLLGDIALHREPPEIARAEEHYRQAFTLTNELEMKPLQAHCHLALGHVFQLRGLLAEARGEILAAASLYDSMEMDFWAARADVSLRNVGMQA